MELNLEENGEKRSKYSAIKVVTSYIENLVLTKKLGPGDKIPTEVELGEILNLGRSSIREAIKALEANGLVTIKRGDGTYISYPDEVILSVPLLYRIILCETMPEELLEFRREMEMSVIRMAIYHAEEEDVEKIRMAHKKLERYISEKENDLDLLTQLDFEFHKYIAEATKNRYYQQLYLFTMELFLPLIGKNYSLGQNATETYDVHTSLLDIIENKKLSEAESAVNNTVKTWGNWVMKQS